MFNKQSMPAMEQHGSSNNIKNHDQYLQNMGD